jgi:hypothetical protein
MRAGHSSLKVSLNRFNIVSTAECKYGDGVQMEELIFWDCNLYEDQQVIVMDILSKNNEKEYLESATEPLSLEEKSFVLGVCYFINNIPIFI